MQRARDSDLWKTSGSFTPLSAGGTWGAFLPQMQLLGLSTAKDGDAIFQLSKMKLRKER